MDGGSGACMCAGDRQMMSQSREARAQAHGGWRGAKRKTEYISRHSDLECDAWEALKRATFVHKQVPQT